MSRFDDRTVVVTGASRGIGAGLAHAFAADGAFVALGCRVQQARAEEVLAEMREAGGDGIVLPFDVTDARATTAALDALARARGAIHVLVNNAGLVRDAWFAMDDPAAFDEVIAVNLRGTANCTRAVARGMLRNGGAVVNVASTAALRASPGQAAYAAAKAGVLGLTRTLAAELAPRGVRVNAVVPGLIDSGMALRMPRQRREALEQVLPLGRRGTVAEVAAAVLFLASDEASYVVGQALAVDGGLSL